MSPSAGLAVWVFLSPHVFARAPSAANGQAIFRGKAQCVRCHSIDNQGGSLGPDLTEIGLRRDAKDLRLAIMDPNAEIAREYLTIVLTTNSGEHVEGIALNEDDISIQVRDAEGNPRSFLKENLRDVRREQRSLMPPYANRLSDAEIDDVVAWLGTLRGHFEPPARRTRTPGPLTSEIAWMNRANRDSQERPEALLDELHITEGATVADLGAGTGYFTWRLAKRVGPRGKVIAVDIQPAMLDAIRSDVAKRRLTNVEVTADSAEDPRLPEGSVDLVLMANSYHEFSEPETMLRGVRRSLKPKGRVAVIEYATEVEEDPTAGVYAMTLAELRGEFEKAGFQLEQILDILPLQHGLIFSIGRQ